MVKKNLVYFFVLMLIVCGNVFAQQVIPLRLGVFTTGNMSPGAEFTYSVRVTETGMLAVETTGDIDTYMKLFDENRNLITENDDGGENLNARIEMLASAGRTYLFVVSGYGGEASGNFRIIAAQRPIPAPTVLRIGTFASGNIVPGQENWYSIRTDQNGLLTVETTSSIDTLLAAYDRNFNFINQDDDSGEGYNARLEIAARSGETYIFRLWGYGDASGPFRVIASIRPYPTPVQLTLGAFQSGTIMPGEDYWFSIRTPRRGGGTLSVRTTGSTDTFLYAFSENYELITQNDDGEDINAVINIPVEANRTYIFRLRGFSADTNGPYRLIASME